MTTGRMRIAYLIPKATNTHTHPHTGCVMLIGFPQQQWLHEPRLMSRTFIRTSPAFSHLTAPYTMIIGEDLSTTLKRTERKTNCSPPTNAETKTA